jgi:hypothetical protein
MDVWKGEPGMHLETKFLWLREQVALGDDIDGWRVCWLGGWGRDQLFYLVMVVRVKTAPPSAGVAFRCGAHERRHGPQWRS